MVLIALFTNFENMASQQKKHGLVYFFYETPVALKERTRLKAFIAGIFKKKKRAVNTINFIFCSDERILEINRQYLRHDYYTDIISFELSAPGEPVTGEIYISTDRVKDNAKQLGHSFTQELYRVIFHGILHFCGYKDKTAADSRKMREREDYYLKQYSAKQQSLTRR